MKRLFLGAAVTLVFLALLARQVHFDRVAETLRAVDYLALLAAIPVYFAGVWFRALRWQQLLSPIARLPSRGLFIQVVIGYMANDVLPLRAGELVRAYLLSRKHTLPKIGVLGTIAIERLTDGLILLAFAGAIALFLPLEGWMHTVLRIMLVLFVGGGAVTLAVLLFRDRLLGTAASLPLRFIGSFLGGADSLRRPGLMAAAGLHGVIAWLFEAALFHVVAVAMGLSVPFSVLLLCMALANLAAALPSSQAGIGPFEYSAAQTLVIFGTDPSVAAAYAILVHAVLILPVTLTGFFFLWREHLSLGQLTREAARAPEGLGRGSG